MSRTRGHLIMFLSGWQRRARLNGRSYERNIWKYNYSVGERGGALFPAKSSSAWKH